MRLRPDGFGFYPDEWWRKYWRFAKRLILFLCAATIVLPILVLVFATFYWLATGRNGVEVLDAISEWPST